MSPTLSGYLNRLLTLNFSLVGGVLGAIFFAKYLLNYLVQASSGRVPADLVAGMAGLVFLSSFQYLLPLSLFFALIVTFSQLRDAQEGVALAAFGLSPVRLLGLFWPSVVGWGMVLAVVVFVLMPWAEGQRHALLVEVGRDPAAQWLHPGTFSRLPEGGVVYVGEGENRRYRDVFVQLSGSAGGERLLMAEEGGLVAVGDWLHLRLKEGTGYRRLEDGSWVRFTFGAASLRTGLPAPPQERVRPRAKSTVALWYSRDPADRAEFHWRVAVVVMLLGLVWATQVLVYPQGRRRSAWPLVSLIALYAVYFNALTISVSWYRKGLVEGAWVIHLFHLLPVLYGWGVAWWWERRYARAG